jgi:hypothetical protein
MTMWLVWLSACAIVSVWLVMTVLLCRQIAAGKWDPAYWPPERGSAAKAVSVEDLKKTLEFEKSTSSITQVRFNREGGFRET